METVKSQTRNDGKKQIIISISHPSKTERWFRHVFGLSASIIAPIGIGVLVGSSAMQWAGFVLGFILFFSLVFSLKVSNKVDSVEEARDVLDRIERGEI